MISLRQRLRREDGQALLIALLLLTFVAVGITALLGLAGASLRTTPVVRQQRGTDYDADGALTEAIQQMRIPANIQYYNMAGCNSVTPGKAGTTPASPAISWNNPNNPLRVDCVTQTVTTIPAPEFQRHFVLTVCPTSVATVPCPDANSLLRADVTFFDTLTPIGVSIQTWSDQR